MKSALPPGPRDRIFGVTYHNPMRRDPLGFAIKVARDYGDFAAVRIGWVRLYFLNRPELVREVLVTKAKSFRKVTRQMRALRKIEGDGLVVSEGASWARHRPLVQGSFHARNFARYADIVVESTRRRLGRWQTDKSFDLAVEMNELALEIIAKLVFDVDVGEQATALRDAVHAFRIVMQRESGDSIVFPDWFPLPGKIRQRRAIRVVDDLIWKLIRDRRDSGIVGDDMLAQIMSSAAANPELGITDEEIRDEVATLFVAGHDTTSAALAWFWIALSQHPDIERRVLAEVDQLGGRPVRHEDLARLKYLEMVVKESMRLYPATAFLFGREAIETVEVGGYTLPRKSWVFISPHIIQRDARYFPDPLTFDPERFAPGRADQIPAYSYLLFGAGPRTCIGNNMATMEIVMLAATVLQRYRLSLEQAVPEPEMEVVLRPKGGLQMLAMAR